MSSDSPAPPPVRLLHGPDASALLFDAAGPEGRCAAAAFFRRLAAPPPRLSRAGRRAGVAGLCGEGFCRRLEAAAPSFPWELV